jgi:outer membrane receptor protein involved in Fe transport
VFVPENIGPDGFQFEETTQPTDNYSATQDVGAAWVIGEAGVGRLKVSAGARLERSVQKVSTFALFSADAQTVESKLAGTALLPAATATLDLGHDMQARAGYGRTLNRPDFRELSPAVYTDVTGGAETHGDPDLGVATIDHVDLRWEWYPSEDESVSFGAFYKQFTDPIEVTVVPSTIHSVSWANALAARDLGVEADFRKDIAAGFFTLGNLAWIDSRVRLAEGGNETSKVRPLQGQSPYVANLGLGFDSPAGFTGTVLLNAVGPRIVEVGGEGLPDLVEHPPISLDVIATQTLGGGFDIGVDMRNLLNPARVITQGGVDVERVKTGWTAGARLVWRK